MPIAITFNSGFGSLGLFDGSSASIVREIAARVLFSGVCLSPPLVHEHIKPLLVVFAIDHHSLPSEATIACAVAPSPTSHCST